MSVKCLCTMSKLLQLTVTHRNTYTKCKLVYVMDCFFKSKCVFYNVMCNLWEVVGSESLVWVHRRILWIANQFIWPSFWFYFYFYFWHIYSLFTCFDFTLYIPYVTLTFYAWIEYFPSTTPLLDYVSLLFDYLVPTLTNTLLLCYCRLWLLSKWHLKCEFAIGLNPSRALLVLSQSF